MMSHVASRVYPAEVARSPVPAAGAVGPPYIGSHDSFPGLDGRGRRRTSSSLF